MTTQQPSANSQNQQKKEGPDVQASSRMNEQQGQKKQNNPYNNREDEDADKTREAGKKAGAQDDEDKGWRAPSNQSR